MDTPDLHHQRHAEQLAHLDAMQARVDQIQGHMDSKPPLAPKDFDTTMAQVRRMAQKDVHPTWMHAAYADLAQRLARVEDLLEQLEASMSLLHTKMETIIGQLAAERPANGRDA